MIEVIRERFDKNLGRVDSLIASYDNLPSASQQGRRPVSDGDLLRAAVVFMHATLEDLLRSLEGWKLPTSAPDFLKDVPLAGHRVVNSPKFNLGDLVAFRHDAVNDLIQSSVNAYLLERNYNDPAHIRRAIEACGSDGSMVGPHAATLMAMMKRRHWIVHQMDRNSAVGPGQHAAQSIGRPLVQKWRDTLAQFGREVLDAFSA